MSAQKLNELWNGKPLHPVLDFDPIEQELGNLLPSEFKAILAVFGLGSFGELRLFHPNRSRMSLRLPDAIMQVRDLIRSLGEQYSIRRFTEIAETCLVLGEVGVRKYLLWDKQSQEWVLWETEMSRETRLGPSLTDFLLRAYTAVVEERKQDESWFVGNLIWWVCPDSVDTEMAIDGD